MPPAMAAALPARALPPRLARPGGASRRLSAFQGRAAVRSARPVRRVSAVAADAPQVGGSQDGEGDDDQPEKPVAQAEGAEAGDSAGDEGKGEKEGKQKEEITDLPFKVGDTVWGTLVSSNRGGARVRIETGSIEGLYGFMPEKEGPSIIKTDERDGSRVRVQKGLRREFLVCKIPEKVEKDGFGPLLSARMHDESLLWHRLQQMQDACRADLATFEVPICGTNRGGLRTLVGGVNGFAPFSQLPKAAEDEWWNEQSADEKYSGKTVKATIREIQPVNRKLVISLKEAESFETMKGITPGKVVSGKVWKIMPYGCMVGIDNTRLSGLLHISAISNDHVREVEDVLMIGDHIKAVVHDMENDWARISLSTRELERYDGEMIAERDACFADAEQTMAELMKDINVVSNDGDVPYDEDDGYY